MDQMEMSVEVECDTSIPRTLSHLSEAHRKRAVDPGVDDRVDIPVLLLASIQQPLRER